MNNISSLVNAILTISPWFIIKIAVLILLVFYLIFAAVLNRQVSLMNQVLEAKFSPFLKFIAVIHLIAILLIFLLVLIFL